MTQLLAVGLAVMTSLSLRHDVARPACELIAIFAADSSTAVRRLVAATCNTGVFTAPSLLDR